MIGCLGVIPGTVAFVFIGVSTAGTMGEEVSLEAAGKPSRRWVGLVACYWIC